MTTVQRMLLGALAAAAAALAGCGAPAKRVVYPERLRSPYTHQPQMIWAVAPPRNESGVSVVDELAVGDALAEELGQVKGIDCLPINRTLGAMRALQLGSIDTPAQAKALARALGADAVVVSTVTSWQPYQPPRIGLNVALFAPTSLTPDDASLADDLRGLREAASSGGPGSPKPGGPSGALSGVSLVLDASNTAIMAKVQTYGEARVETNDPMGWERYSKSMSLYTRFACHTAVERLLDAERSRLSQSTVTQAADKTDSAR